jgi:hypothetical protein
MFPAAAKCANCFTTEQKQLHPDKKSMNNTMLTFNTERFTGYPGIT